MFAHDPMSSAYRAQLSVLSTTEGKQLVCLLCAYPIAAILRRLPTTDTVHRNLFSVMSSVLILCFVFGQVIGVLSFAFSAIGAYTIAACVHGRQMPWIGFVFVIGNSFYHLLMSRRVTSNLSNSDVMAGVQMVLVTKLTMFCWNVHDGRLSQEGLSAYRQRRALHKLPGLLDFAGYVAFFPSLLAGPTFDFHMYARWLSCSKPEAGCDRKTSEDLSWFKTFENVERRRAASWKTVQAILWLGASNFCSKYCNATSILTDHYFQSNLILKVLLLQVLALGMRTKLYGIWSLTEGACIVSGIGYEGIDAETGSGRWDEIQNVNPWSLETAQNAHAFVGNWNMRVHNWLYHYVYIRVTPEGKKPGLLASMATFLVSAIWHGYWPGFYLTFVLSSLVHVVAKDLRRFVRPLLLEYDGKTPTPYKQYYDVLGCLVTHLAFCFTTAPVAVLGLRDSLRVWSAVYFYCPVAAMLLMAVFASPARSWLVAKQQGRKSTKHTRRGPIACIAQSTISTRGLATLLSFVEGQLYRRNTSRRFEKGAALLHS